MSDVNELQLAWLRKMEESDWTFRAPIVRNKTLYIEAQHPDNKEHDYMFVVSVVITQQRIGRGGDAKARPVYRIKSGPLKGSLIQINSRSPGSGWCVCRVLTGKGSAKDGAKVTVPFHELEEAEL